METAQYSTFGKRIFPGYELPLVCLRSESGMLAVPCDRLVLLIVTKGKGTVRTSSALLPLSAPVCVCLNEQESASIELENTAAGYAVFFHPSVVNELFNFKNIRRPAEGSSALQQDGYWLLPFLQRSELFAGAMPIGPNGGVRAVQLFEQLEGELTAQADSFWPGRSRALFLEILFFVSKIYAHKTDVPAAALAGIDADVESLIRYLNENYAQKITIGDITGRLCTNRTTISKKFMAAVHMSIMEYLAQIRISMACVLLKDTSLPVSEIVYRVGFNDQAHFLRSFRNGTGVSPSAYREKNNRML
jgi:AraC family L-rhamnose operon regulatory protein RhaS